MSLIGLLVFLLIIALIFGGYGHGAGWGYAGWSPFGLLLVIFLLLVLVGGVHAADLAPVGLAGFVVLGLQSPVPGGPSASETGSAGPPGLPFAVSYWIGIAITVLLAVQAYIVAQYMGGHGADLPLGMGTPQGFASVSMAGVALGVIGRFIPNVQHTVGLRKRELLHARMGVFPRDLHKLAAGGEPPTH